MNIAADAVLPVSLPTPLQAFIHKSRYARGLAAEHGVPLLSAPPLARALYHGTRLGQEIPAGLYQAVAQVLAYVYALRRQRREGGAAPVPPTDLPVPDEHAVRGEETSE